MTAPATAPDLRRQGIGDVLRQIAWLLILVVLIGRMTFNESFMVSEPVNLNALLTDTPLDLDPINRELLARGLFSTLLLAAAGAWALALATDPHARLRFPLWGGAIATFTICSAVSTVRAADAVQAWAVWWDQTTILLGGYVVAQLATRQRLRQWVLILAALATTLAVKSLYQVLVEFPLTRQFVADHPEVLGELSSDSDSVWATLYRLRLAAVTPSGFFSHANVFASTVLVLLGAVVALAWSLGRTLFATSRPRPLGYVVLFVITCIATGLTVVMLVLTGSEAAMGVAVVVAVVAAAIAWRRHSLARHPRLCGMAAMVTVIVIAGGVIVTAPMLAEMLPGGLGKSLAARSEYWSTSRMLIAQEPVWGVGGGHFAGAYLQQKPPSAEEDAQAPHNVVLHAVVQFGLLGGGVYLLCLLLPLLAVTAPAEAESDDMRPLSFVSFFALCALPIAAMMASRTFLDGNVGGTVFLFPLCMVVWLILDRRLGLTDTNGMVLLLGAGVAAMAIHNLITLSLWLPGPALLFWSSLGLLVGMRRAPVTLRLPGLSRFAPAAVFLGLLCVCVAGAFVPAACATARWTQVCNATLRGETTIARRQAAWLAENGSPRDAISAARLATAMMDDETLDAAARSRLADTARRGAARATSRLPDDASIVLHAARISWALGDPDDAIARFERVVELDPTGMATRLMLAECYDAADRPADVAKQIEAIQAIDAALPAQSAYRLTPSERKRLGDLLDAQP